MSKKTFRLVVVESPFAGDVEANLTYVRRAMADCFSKGEYPFASHALYTQPGVLDDTKPEERKLGIEAGFAWGAAAESVIFYVDRGISRGMLAGVQAAMARDCCIEVRALDRETTHADLVALGLRGGEPS